MVDTTIYIGSVAVHEPMTAFTDYIITAMALVFYWKIPAGKGAVIKYWRFFFLFLGLSTFLGANAHAFFGVHEGAAYKTWWLSMQFVNGFAVYFAQQATLLSVLKNSKYYTAWKWSYVLQLVIYYIVLILVQKYVVTIVDNALGLIPIMIVHFAAKEKKEYYKWIGYGILVSFLTAIVHGAKFSLCDYFNFNDLAHVFIMISLTVMYLGVRRAAVDF